MNKNDNSKTDLISEQDEAGRGEAEAGVQHQEETPAGDGDLISVTRSDDADAEVGSWLLLDPAQT